LQVFSGIAGPENGFKRGEGHTLRSPPQRRAAHPGFYGAGPPSDTQQHSKAPAAITRGLRNRLLMWRLGRLHWRIGANSLNQWSLSDAAQHLFSGSPIRRASNSVGP